MTDAPPPYPGINGYTGYQQSVGAGGFTNPSGASANMSSAEAKAAEAAGKITIYEHFVASSDFINFFDNFFSCGNCICGSGKPTSNCLSPWRYASIIR